MYTLISIQLWYVSLFTAMLNPTWIVVLRTISEILGVLRVYPACYMLKVILDLGIREPLQLCIMSGMRK